MRSETTAATEGEILSRAIETLAQSNWRPVARLLSKLKLPTSDLDRVDRLLKKNRAGTLTERERTELDKYLRVGNFLDLLRARALRQLRETGA